MERAKYGFKEEDLDRESDGRRDGWWVCLCVCARDRERLGSLGFEECVRLREREREIVGER